MPETFKFPNGYDVTVLRKQDILECIDENILDKEVVLAVIQQCEIDASNFISSGRWTGIPFLGNIRVPKRVQKLNSPEVKELIEEARNTLDSDKFIIFRHQLNASICREEKQERLYKFTVSRFVSQNRNFYKKLLNKYGETVAQFMCYTLSDMSVLPPKDIF